MTEEKLALLGGRPIVDRPLGSDWPIYGKEEEEALMKVLRSRQWWRGGYGDWKESFVGRFEDAFAAYQHAKWGIAVTNGTQALECALKAAGVEPGDEVVVPALTFVASATAVALVGAIPRIVDVDPATYNISTDAIADQINERTRAIIPVHNGGFPCDMDAINALAEKKGLTVIEDCAHAHGSEYKGRRVGALGHLGAFSFQQFKTLTAGEGGIVLTNDDELAEKAFSFMHIGRLSGRPFYEFHRIASNLRMTEWQGAILLAQLSRFDEQVEIRERNSQYLAQQLDRLGYLKPLPRDFNVVTRWCFYYWNFKFVPEAWDGVHRDTFLKALRAEGVPCSVGAHGEPIYRNPVFQRMNFGRTGFPIRCPCCGTWRLDYRQVFCPEAERIYRTEACSFPHALFLGPRDDMDLILEAINKVYRHRSQLLTYQKEKETE
ncbi:MAG: DegT/DnrJ/EryC1/StrS family aminotransferase [Armatimonadetes bacterium]|nr:DegT/DnrJ/EryC1/StrS family aminotransferase [Armatimonadota bacterium]MDW8122807.1 DegT/DnrJ/EryC1/StrS family aminotransferase [Armatimonadota bacterium]